MGKIKTSRKTTSKEPFDVMGFAAAAWIISMLVLLPNWTHNAYADVLTTKYGFCLVADGILLGVYIIWALASGHIKKSIEKMKSYADPETGKWFGSWFKAEFSILDIFMLIFLVIVVTSTLQAYPYIYQAFFGNEGRWHGAIILSLYVLTYFVVSRHYVFKKWHITAFLIGFLYICIWAITDYFKLDILYFKYGIAEEHYDIFVSSIGNIDTYTAVAMIPFAFAGIMLIQSEEKTGRLVFYWICSFVAMVSMITSAADNAYLSFFAFYAFAPFIAFKSRRGVRRYLLMLASFVTAIELVVFWNAKYGDAVVKPSGVVSILEGIPQLKTLLVILWIAVIILYVYDLAIKKYSITTPAPKFLHTAWLVLTIAGFAGVIVLVILANQDPPVIPAVLEPARDYLQFTDSWGMWRGLVWKKLMDLYNSFPAIHKVFGAGPETAGIYLQNNYYNEIAEASGLFYDSPHNELLQMFFTMGPIGLISYLGIMISPSVLAARRTLKKCYPVIAAICIVCICHVFECWVNIMVPMDVPTIFALIAIACNLYRKSKEGVTAI